MHYSINWFFKHCLIRQWCSFSEPEVTGQAEALNCIISQSQGKFTACSCLWMFSQLLAKNYTYHVCTKRQNPIFINYNSILWWAMEPWYELMVEVPLQVDIWSHRTNNKCRLVILAPYIMRNHEIYNGSGKVSWIFFLSCTAGWLDLAGVLLGTSELGDMHLPIWQDEWS